MKFSNLVVLTLSVKVGPGEKHINQFYFKNAKQGTVKLAEISNIKLA